MDHATCGVPRELPHHILKEITCDFSEERKLGSGAFGKVYKGVYNDGEKIAVKVLCHMPGIDDKQFENEFHNLASLQHENIVRLVNYCYEIQRKIVEHEGRLVFAEKTFRALCLEYMHNGSLDKYLSDECHGLDWKTRYAIIKGICLGLKYLHVELKSPIYHLDLKPANILLDENMVPKIADFGLSRLFGEERTRITRSSTGTIGYMPPEYIERNVISNKFDIFSLGVVIIKIMTGPTGYSKCGDMPPHQFIDLVHGNWTNRIRETTPSHMLDLYLKQVKRCIEIALSCLEADRYQRPRIGHIVDMLNVTETMIRRSHLPHWLIHCPGLSVPKISNRLDEELQPALLSRQLLCSIVEGSAEAWAYGILWESSLDKATGSFRHAWVDGYYKGHDEDVINLNVTAEEHEHRKRVLGEFDAFVPGGDIVEHVTDTQWFFFVSMTHSFRSGTGILGQALLDAQPRWITNGLSDSPCARARQAYTLGIRTMVCVLVSTGVIELGSTKVNSRSTETIAMIHNLFGFPPEGH